MLAPPKPTKARADHLFRDQLYKATRHGNPIWLGRLLDTRPGFDLRVRLHYERTPLMWSCLAGGDHSACVRLLLHRGADPNTKGYTALMSAAAYGRLDCITLLLAFGADPLATCRDDNSVNALSIAHECSQPAVIGFLSTTAGWPALKLAVSAGLCADAKVALRLGRIDTSGCTLAGLLAVAMTGDAEPDPNGGEPNPGPNPIPDPDPDADPNDDGGADSGAEDSGVDSDGDGDGDGDRGRKERMLAFVRLVMAPWSPSNHHLHHTRFRCSVRTVVLVGVRLAGVQSDAVGRRRSIRRRKLPPLPALMWELVGSFFGRGDWPALADNGACVTAL